MRTWRQQSLFLIQISCLSSPQCCTWCCLFVAQTGVMTWLTVFVKCKQLVKGKKACTSSYGKIDSERYCIFTSVCRTLNVKLTVLYAELKMGRLISSTLQVIQNWKAVHGGEKSFENSCQPFQSVKLVRQLLDWVTMEVTSAYWATKPSLSLVLCVNSSDKHYLNASFRRQKANLLFLQADWFSTCVVCLFLSQTDSSWYPTWQVRL